MSTICTDLAESFLRPAQWWDETRCELRLYSPIISAFEAFTLWSGIDNIVPVVDPEAHACLTKLTEQLLIGIRQRNKGYVLAGLECRLYKYINS